MAEQTDCILCKIARGEISSKIIYEDETTLGILDTNPCTNGHCLVLPKKHTAYFYDMDDEEMTKLFKAVKVITEKLKRAFNPDHVSIFARGGRIHHTHIAVIPSMEGDELSGFPQSQMKKATMSLDEVAEKIQNS